MKNLKELSFRGCKGSPSSASWFLPFPINLMRWSSDPMALSLPSSLSGLCSLTKLDISYCDLGEGAIPSGIGNLCSLEELHLSGNNFFTLPASIYRLSKLSKIFLKDCKMLQNLPRLPASIHGIFLDGCVSLETLSDGYWRDCSIVVPGSEIPEWFEYQNNEGSSITISTPPKTYKNHKLVGYAMCCVFRVPKYSLPYYNRWSPDPVHMLSIYSKPTTSGFSGFEFRKQIGQAMSDHLFLYYQNRGAISEVEFSSPSGLELKRCGVHPIYVHQGDKFNQTSDPVWNLNEFGHDCLGSTSFTRSLNDDLDRAEASGSCCRDDAGSTTSSERSFLKRSLEEYVGAAEASGSGCCNDDEEPQPKRFRLLE
ncbi:hypothetical protein CISIN_1g040119mg [Citrus sinensis]|uniref:C-JID domain-containing protein n=1 Tax=Citrus sinensis TaxID=2711 RepID=A0A067DLU1_CITSI|nr:hypothetical protein CISIN_1g040119mg [Citrus sinensis]